MKSALLAARKNKRIVTLAEFEEARDKVMMGSERRSMVMTEEEKTLTAYHEAGHAIVTINERRCTSNSQGNNYSKRKSP